MVKLTPSTARTQCFSVETIALKNDWRTGKKTSRPRMS